MPLSEKEIKQFHNDGYLILENFLSTEEVARLQKEMFQIVEDMNPDDHQCNAFKTGKDQDADDYFLTSADKIRFFFEDGARDTKGKLIVDKHLSLNKVAHALHALNPVFREVTFSEKVKDVATGIGFTDPAVVQSMYIFKQPNIGGKVVPHRDAWFLHTKPTVRLFAVWIALEDATLENGCLWFVPGSHKEDIETRFVRQANRESGKLLDYTAPLPDVNDREFIPGPVKAGSAVIIDGSILHKSEANKSEKSRHIYTFHAIDVADGTRWSEENWLVIFTTLHRHFTLTAAVMYYYYIVPPGCSQPKMCHSSIYKTVEERPIIILLLLYRKNNTKDYG